MNKKNFLASIPEIIAEAKAGKIFILVDDEGRENEGDLVIPASMCGDQEINFMAKYGRGLICLTLTEERVRKLELPLMSLHNQSRHQTAFTVSIEAREGISTGISAFDRAKTVRDAIDPNKGKESLVSPGHIFPLKAESGGVLVRAGHTEAAVDIARLADLNPSGVICEIMNDDGSMARMPDLIKFAKKHNLKIATIADLIEYRRQNEKLIECKEKRKFVSKHGEFDLVIYQSKVDMVDHVVLIKGKIDKTVPTLVRMHHLNIFSDCLEDAQNPRSGSLAKAMKKISKHGNGVIVVIRQPSESISHMLEASEKNKKTELRNYGTGAQILSDLGITNMTLLTNSKKSVIGLEGYDIKICGYRKL